MTSRLISCVTALAAACLLVAMAHAPTGDIVPPEALKEFWTRWTEAEATGRDEDLDKVVRRHGEDARLMLNTLLDDVCRKDEQELYYPIRMLAWSLDRVERTERYITRARTVLDMDMRSRGQRAIALARYDKGQELFEEARTKRSDEAWEKAASEFRGADAGFAEVGDVEFRILSLLSLAQVQRERGWYWDEAQVLKQILPLAESMPYEDGDGQFARDGIAVVKERGIDPDGPRPEGGGAAKGGDEVKSQGGTGLTSFAPGSDWQEFQLAFTVPRKGITGVVLPSFGQPEQYQLWQQGYVVGEGPGDFDFLRNGRFKPGGRNWTLRRDGIETFLLDSDGDGEADVTFPASSSPFVIEVPVGDGIWPVMVCTFDQRELMFDFEFNYAPTVDGARFRFWLASLWEGEVLGEAWKVYDTNLDGAYGVAWENFDDLVTIYSDDEHVSWFDVDSVQIGRSKSAIPMSRIMPVAGGYHRVEADPGKGTVRTREMNLATGSLLLDYDIKTMPSHLVVREVGELEGVYFDVMPDRKKKPVTLPVGTYQICMGRVSKGSQTSQDQVRIYTGNSQPFTISAGQTTTLEMGAPFDLTFATKKDGGDLLVDTRTIRCFGRAGEEYAMFFDDALQPEIHVRTAEGQKVGKPIKTRQTDVGEWQANTGPDNILWFPLAERVTPVPGATLEFQMTQKTHTLLGGPFESGWIR